MAKRIDGKVISKQIKDELKEEVAQLKAKGIEGSLAVIQVGNDPASSVYVNNKKKACEYIGIGSISYELPEETTEAELLDIIEDLNKREDVCGILVQLPVPKHIDEDKIIQAISPKKDVDGFHPQSVGAMTIGEPGFLSCTPAGIIQLLKRSNIEIEGKHWNADIKQMTDAQWHEMVRSMYNIGMDVIVIQEVFRNQEYVGQHKMNVDNYPGKAFYPSELYPDRVPIMAHDPLEAILSEADKLGMSVMMGVGMFAWFDFSAESLEWHKQVAKELWNKYGSHPSFYSFYISEECAGNLYNSEQTYEMQLVRKKEICDFFREFKKYIKKFAPEKPIMLATNSMGVLDGADAYPALLQNLDILCPFGFARMPKGDLTGKEAADILQNFCDDAGAHLWFDLEAFLFNPDNSLYPRPIEEIIHDLTLLDNFEKVLCYQYPGVFNDPKMSRRIGEKRTIKLYQQYQKYMNDVKRMRRNNK